MDFSGWTTEELEAYEERLYDDDVDGADVWFTRDQVLWELSRRNVGNVNGIVIG